MCIANQSQDEGGWYAHTESINKCFLFCFGAEWHIFSTSHDGFQRVWSVEGTLLGEMRLPNVEHRHYVNREHVDWEMAAETVGVTAEHLAIGDRLTGRTATMKRMKTTSTGVMKKLARMRTKEEARASRESGGSEEALRTEEAGARKKEIQ